MIPEHIWERIGWNMGYGLQCYSSKADQRTRVGDFTWCCGVCKYCGPAKFERAIFACLLH
jgi:hypothetical protein